MPVLCIQELQVNPDVDGIYEDGIGGANTASEYPTAIQTNATWGLARLSSNTTLKYTNVTATDFTFYYDPLAGESSDIYVIDSGVYLDHTDFGGRVTWGITYVGKDKVDEYGHGTFCASGLAAGATYGVAKKANIIAVKVLDSIGRGATSVAIAGLNYVYQMAQTSGHPSVVSFSLTWKAFKPLDDAVNKVAAGNDAEDASLYSPCRAQNAITVAASDILDRKRASSNYGLAVFMFAPGSDIVSTSIENEHSAPYVAGIVASFQPHANMSIEDVKLALHKTSLINVLKDIRKSKALFTPNRLAQNGFPPKEQE
ncbi:hypothetical protein C0995_000832 [Termitomyces sp. Mi166|nr:hypothetical protein C0995_000832 [Termitomyces sp. Mi166\